VTGLVDERDRDGAPDPSGDAHRPVPGDLEAHWAALVTAALLGTDRRDPPQPPPVLRDVVDDTAREAPSERMLAQVAACASVRRAGVRPAPPRPPMTPPAPDPRPVCPPAAIARWHHVVTTWPVLEDEWTTTLLANGWRAAPELVPAMLDRARTDDVRWARTLAAAGPLGAWLVEHLPELAPRRGRSAPADPVDLTALPALPIPPDLEAWRTAPAAAIGAGLAGGIESRRLGAAHRAVLVNLVARLPAEALDPVARALGAVDPSTSGHGLAAALADLATARRRMLDELRRPEPAG
jgi:hypothetical protein